MDLMIEGVKVKKVFIEEIPVIYIEPKNINKNKMVLFLGGLGSTKEALISYLNDIANRGYYAFSFDNYGHGERGNESRNEIFARVFGNMRKHGWKILGYTVDDSIKVIEWVVSNFHLDEEVYMGGISMGGDIAIATAGVCKKIKRVVGIVCTPDWLRPGMHEVANSNVLMDPGIPDEVSLELYKKYNPITHLDRYIDGPKIKAIIGEQDNHIPPENIERFKRELGKLSNLDAKKIEIEYIRGQNSNHIDVLKRKDEWWPSLLKWFLE